MADFLVRQYQTVLRFDRAPFQPLLNGPINFASLAFILHDLQKNRFAIKLNTTEVFHCESLLNDIGSNCNDETDDVIRRKIYKNQSANTRSHFIAYS